MVKSRSRDTPIAGAPWMQPIGRRVIRQRFDTVIPVVRPIRTEARTSSARRQKGADELKRACRSGKMKVDVADTESTVAKLDRVTHVTLPACQIGRSRRAAAGRLSAARRWGRCLRAGRGRRG